MRGGRSDNPDSTNPVRRATLALQPQSSRAGCTLSRHQDFPVQNSRFAPGPMSFILRALARRAAQTATAAVALHGRQTVPQRAQGVCRMWAAGAQGWGGFSTESTSGASGAEPKRPSPPVGLVKDDGNALNGKKKIHLSPSRLGPSGFVTAPHRAHATPFRCSVQSSTT